MLGVHQDGVFALAKLDGGLLASGSMNNIKIWNVAAGACVSTFRGHRGGVRALARLDGGLLASGSSDKNIKIWNVAAGVCVLTFRGHDSGVQALARLDGGLLASASTQDGAMKVERSVRSPFGKWR